MALVPNPNDYPSRHAELPTPKKSVVENEVKKSDTTLVHKFWDIFQLQDLAEIKTYIFNDLIRPGFKRGIRGIVDIILDGEIRTESRSSGTRYINYNKKYDEREKPASRSTNRKPNRDFGRLEFETRQDADKVRKELIETLNRYHEVSIGTFYELCGIDPFFTDYNFGWTNLGDLDIKGHPGHYVLDLPRAEPLNQ